MGDITEHGLPYPVGTDRVMDGDNAIQALAEAVDDAIWGDDTGWVNATMAAGWTAFVGYTPQVRRIGRVVHIRGMVSKASGTALSSAMLTVPAEFRPSTTTLYGVGVAPVGNAACQLAISPGGAVNTPASYQSGTPSATDNFPISGSWALD